jgi:hypothetical protein
MIPLQKKRKKIPKVGNVKYDLTLVPTERKCGIGI